MIMALHQILLLTYLVYVSYDFAFVSAQDPVSTTNGGSTTPTAPAPGKKTKKSRGKDAAGDSGNGDAGTAENNEPASITHAVKLPWNQ